MYVIRIIIISFLLLFAAVCASAQVKMDSAVVAPEDTPGTFIARDTFDVKGTNVNDTSMAFGTDTILPADTTKAKGNKHTAMKAVWRSAVLPGLGQAYNKKYWKIPIIYAGFGGLAYALYFTSKNFNEARTVYRALVRNQFTWPNGSLVQFQGYSDVDDVKYFRDTYKNYLNISALVTVIWYGLNLVDAAVDGHLYNYNMDDKLSFNFDPSFLLPPGALGTSQTCLGMTLTIVPLGGNHTKRALVSF